MPKINGVDTRIAQLGKYLPDLLSDIAAKDDEQIIRTAAYARRLGMAAFLIRGMCASVLRRRYPNRLSGGRGKRDQAGLGIQAQMTRLAEQAGVDRRTLEVDARISDTFFADVDQTTLEHIPSLAREYYVIALSALDPRAAIKEAAERCSEPCYGLRQFRADVRLSKRVAGSPAAISVTEHTYPIRVRIPIEVGELMTELITISQKTGDEIVAEAIRTLHAALTKHVGRKRRVTDTQPTSAQTQGDRQLELML
jgi:hypothetical protein